MNNNTKVLTFLYHEVVDDPKESGFQRKNAIPYKHKVKEFEDNINIILKNSEKITTYDQLNNESSNKLTLLTFDDGGKSSMHIADVLDRNNIKGHFFITTSLIGDKYFLNEEEIKNLHQRGHKIGSHSHTHPFVFKSLTYEEMLVEWSLSKNILEEILNTPVDICSIPGGAADKKTYISANEIGYKFIFNSEPVLEIKNFKSLKIIGRVYPKQGTDYQVIENLSRLKGIKKQKMVRELKKAIKRIINPFK